MWGPSDISKYTSNNNREVPFLQFSFEFDRASWTEIRYTEIEKDCVFS